jgi:dihydrolipoamide dehydrogenase
LVPPDWTRFGDRILTTDTLFEQRDLPPRIAVIGMGPLGLEMAQALSRLGVEVAGFDAVETLAGLSDPQIIAALRGALEREFPLYLGTPAELSEAGGAMTVSNEAGRFTADAVLAAVGRRPNIDGLGLETLGVELDDKGMPPVDPMTLQIGDLPVWLAGDANGDRALLHESADEGHIAGRNAAAETPRTYCRRIELAIVFASPQVARVGGRWADLDPDRTATGSVDFSKQGRARTAERAEGLLHVYADTASGKLAGAEMCAPAAEHLAHLLALAIQQELGVADMLAMPFYHPVLEEGLRSALRELSRQVPGGGGSDLADCPALDIDALE